jgi:hypothetical protein
MGGEVFGWFFDAWHWVGTKVSAGLEFTGDMTRSEKLDLINYLSFLNINRKMEQWVTGFDARLLWFIIIAGAAWYVLARTQIGSWIYATGDNKESARANGVPVNRVKIGLFMFSAFCATIFATCQVFDTNSSDAAKGMFKELEAIAIAVVGGILMTGGFGTVIGVVFGAVTFGLVANAVFFIPWIDGAWFRVFVGTVLLAAVFANERIRKRITGGIRSFAKTAAKSTVPTKTRNQAPSIQGMKNTAFATSPNVTAPKTTPITVPKPPVMRMPPTTAIAMASNSLNIPFAASEEFVSKTWQVAKMVAQNAENMKRPILTRFTGTPFARALSLLSPVA